MSVMYDSNIIIDILHGKYEAADDEVCICGVIRTEILRGAVSEKDYRSLDEMLSALEYVPMDELMWNTLSRKAYVLRTNGVTVPLSDLIIYQICSSSHISLRTRDVHFELIDKLFGEVEIFSNQSIDNFFTISPV